MKRPTQKDVAQRAGVSRSTVSYVLNDQTQLKIPISEETRQRVMDAIAEIGYEPDARAQSLREKNKKIIVDISRCEFIDSTFLGVLVLSLKSIAKIGGDLRLVKPDEVVKALMEKAGTLNVFNLYDTLDEAIQSFEIKGDQNYYLAEGSPILN